MSLTTTTHVNFRDDAQDESEADQVMYDQGENSFFVSVRGQSVEEVTGYWDKLSEGATVVVPMGPAGWAPAYGMLRDRFGVVWVLDVASEYNG